MVSLWFEHDTSLMLMIEILKIMREKMAKTKCSVSGALGENKFGNPSKKNLEKVSSDALRSLQRCPRRRVKDKMLQISFFAEVGTQGQRQLAVKYTRECECHANEV